MNNDAHVVDEYCAQKGFKVGSEFRMRDLDWWLTQNGFPAVYRASAMLAAHRMAVGARRYTLERVSWGRGAFWRVVETPTHYSTKATARMHERQLKEFVHRWFNEATYRMNPLALRDRRAMRILQAAADEISAFAEEKGIEVQEELNRLILNGKV